MAVFCGKRLADPNAGCHIESEATRHSTKRSYFPPGSDTKFTTTRLFTLAEVGTGRMKLGLEDSPTCSDEHWA
ncbi:unnamed protein product [Caenorhabditis auriculariae]|uniref:Uncharacterized protein n=1 Tax=Caenorhabditis auriculariae TaxID=2777116 RepID=A0A8S1HZJ1_9PELO|nr:unnamed protein product [Caenorhabditis auriculariae]